MSNDRDDQFPPKNSAAEGAAGEVLRLNEFGGADPGRLTIALRDYWESLRKGRAIPDRGDVEPRGIGRVLDYAFILERIAPGAARFRLAGRHLVDLMGMEVRGMPLCSFIQPSARGRLSDVLETVFKGPQIAEFELRAAADYARPELEGRLLLLPLKSDLGDITRALGCLVSTGDIGRGPRRFDIARDSCFPIIKGGSVIAPSPSGFAEDPEPWRPPLRSVDPEAGATAPKDDATPEERRARFRIISD